MCLAESYPDECWMFCNTAALAAIRMSDALDATDHSALFHKWLRTAREKLVDRQTGLLVSSFTLEGRPKDGPEGSSIWMSAHCLQLIDAKFAADQYRRARRRAGTSRARFRLCPRMARFLGRRDRRRLWAGHSRVGRQRRIERAGVPGAEVSTTTAISAPWRPRSTLPPSPTGAVAALNTVQATKSATRCCSMPPCWGRSGTKPAKQHWSPRGHEWQYQDVPGCHCPARSDYSQRFRLDGLGRVRFLCCLRGSGLAGIHDVPLGKCTRRRAGAICTWHSASPTHLRISASSCCAGADLGGGNIRGAGAGLAAKERTMNWLWQAASHLSG